MSQRHLPYTPPSTRATLAELGIPVEARIDGHPFSVPPHELAGETAWRVDVIRWFVRKVFLVLVSLPKDDRIPELLKMEQALMTEHGFHKMEAEAIAERALTSYEQLGYEKVELLRNAMALQLGDLQTQLDELVQRFKEIVLNGDRAGQQQPASTN